MQETARRGVAKALKGGWIASRLQGWIEEAWRRGPAIEPARDRPIARCASVPPIPPRSRALGEFGAAIMVAGNIPGETQTTSLAILQLVVKTRSIHRLS